MTAATAATPIAGDDPDEPPADVLRYSTDPRVGAKAGQPRRCTECGRYLTAGGPETPTSASAYRDNAAPRGYGYRCVPCHNAIQRARMRKSYVANPEAVRARKRKWYAANRDTLHVGQGEWRAANRGILRVRSRAQRAAYAARSDAALAADRARLRPDGLKRCRSCHARLPLAAFYESRVRPDGLADKCKACDFGGLRPRMAAYWTAIGQPDWYLRRCYLCHGALGENYHVEHVIPAAAGGTGDVENLMPACVACNLSKKARNVADVVIERHPLWRGLSPDHPAVQHLHALADPTSGCTNPAAAVEFIRRGPASFTEAG